MCGIAGVINYKYTLNPSIIQAMTNAIKHRGPDANNTFATNHIQLGHTRLSIIDLSQAANQPMHSTCGRYTIIFNGEVYNYKEIKQQLTTYNFTTNGDTETVLAAYIQWGVKSINLLKGMFAYTIWDAQEQQLIAVRDRLGVKPFYYYNHEANFIFGSEVRTVLASGLVPAAINHSALSQYFQLQSFYAPHTLIKNICQLQAGHYLTHNATGTTITTYWNIESVKDNKHANSKSLSQIHNDISNLLHQSVEYRMVADVPVAAFLSGGIDSSIVVGLMAQYTTKPIETFNISFAEKEFDESKYASIVAKKFNTNHHQINLTATHFLNELVNALDSMDTPSGDGVNTYVVSKAVKANGIKVAMSGIGGDELFAGYPSFKQWHSIQSKSAFWHIPTPLRKLLVAPLSSSNKNTSRIKSLLSASQLNMQTFYPLIRQIFSTKQISSLLKSNDPYVYNYYGKSIHDFPILSQLTIAELQGYTQHTLLKDTDQMSMAVALEVREPFFDHSLIEYILQIPDSIKYPSYPKSLLVESMGDMLPQEIVHRKKQGFLFPWEHWLRNELKDFAHNLITSFAQREFVHQKFVLNYWQQFLNNSKQTRWVNVWVIIVLEYWLQKNKIQ